MPDIKPYPITRSLIPENQESPIHFLSAAITPEPYFFRRNHFPYPAITGESFLLPVSGEVMRPLTFHSQDLLRMPSKEIAVVMECSGNNRSRFQPEVYGEQWEGGAVSQGVWRGVPLRDLLKWTGLSAEAKEIVFEGTDSGKRTGQEGTFTFARSLPLDKALHPDTIIAYELNGKPIPFEHGYPLRLIVPQWYAMASVKWLRKITAIRHHFQGPFQESDYMYFPEKNSDEGKTPVTAIHVNSIIQQPINYSVLKAGTHRIHGLAWTGNGRITTVEVSTDGGKRWEQATIQGTRDPYGWVTWTYAWAAFEQGDYTLMSKAADSAGFIQPAEARWNRKGYGYNAYSTVNVKIE
ncbi:sulfite oxidase [Cohnella caldifontis]|uniref:sulfite oxidase n=1 Tax=Cohnella caldifontis TaxID=3027471 RepID=UPI0023EAA7D1|nr:sulfite oxidase [Cohnella sp. YIM B05605]